ncbi:MAG: hypothetical protein CMK09_14215 [Ponticaulis sp.]|nr:hypothetical protein [Ponticaulis sp.]|tara:strand:- start:82530 stop:84605 length:2076 start_codon:yes stop_codon:yes gene_type:complete
MRTNWKTILAGGAAVTALMLAGCGQQSGTEETAANAPAADAPAVEVASFLGDFRLIDQTGKGHQLFYWKDVPAVVLISHCEGCEASAETLNTIETLKADYADSEIPFMAINSTGDARKAVAAEAEANGWTTPILMDETKLVSEDLGVSRAGEVFVLSPKKGFKVIYHGAVEGSEGSLKAALDQAVAGEEVTVASATDGLKGTYIALPERDNAAEIQNISYAEDVAPILIENCAECHAEGGIAPWAMTDYTKIRGWAPMMKQVVMDDRMPPWGPDTTYRPMHDSRAMSIEEKQTLIHWIDAGAPRGEGEDPFEGLNFAAPEWPADLGEPDLVLEVPEFTIPATGIVDYQYPAVANPQVEDKWLKATAIIPGDRSAVHHALTGYMSEMPANGEGRESNWEFSTGTYAVGEEPMIHMDNSGSPFPAGGAIGFQMHYTPIGKEVVDTTKVGFYFHDEKPKHYTRSYVIIDPTITLPAGDGYHEEVAYMDWPADATLYGIYPHGHFRLARTLVVLERKDGTSETLLNIPRYDFNWQFDYRFEEPLDIKAGDRIVTRYWYDNSERNFSNPDPEKVVTWGDQSFEEMMYTRLTYQWVGETTDNLFEDTQEELQSGMLFGALDDNMSGKIELAEVQRGQFAAMAPMMMGQFDKDGDNALSKEEMGAATQMMMRRQFRGADRADNPAPSESGAGATGGDN